MLNYTVSELVHLCVRIRLLVNLQGQSRILTRRPVTESKWLCFVMLPFYSNWPRALQKFIIFNAVFRED